MTFSSRVSNLEGHNGEAESLTLVVTERGVFSSTLWKEITHGKNYISSPHPSLSSSLGGPSSQVVNLEKEMTAS